MSRPKHVKKKTITERVGGTMNLILLFVGIVGLAFTITMIIVFCRLGMVPDVLITCVFAALFGECGAMSVIKSVKIRNQDRQWQKEDEAKGTSQHPQFESDGKGEDE